ncbi:hypothetical protein NPIL_626281 [Nephila pilipes]|uniref:Uncharacterized protein n=1 Tax=Nephila pilipes TaxID=299642 RepID=A0A8X6P7X0_NEPPI|nr:hypothetical protein NPIL_626281 [Nephila pilipes]
MIVEALIDGMSLSSITIFMGFSRTIVSRILTVFSNLEGGKPSTDKNFRKTIIKVRCENLDFIFGSLGFMHGTSTAYIRHGIWIKAPSVVCILIQRYIASKHCDPPQPLRYIASEPASPHAQDTIASEHVVPLMPQIRASEHNSPPPCLRLRQSTKVALR